MIEDMSLLFESKDTCNPNIGSWDVSSVTHFLSYEISPFFNNHLFESFERSLEVESP